MKTLKQNTDLLKSTLKNTIILIVKNGLQYQRKLSISGSVHIIVDQEQELVVNIDQFFSKPEGEKGTKTGKDQKRRRKSSVSNAEASQTSNHVRNSEEDQRAAKSPKLSEDMSSNGYSPTSGSSETSQKATQVPLTPQCTDEIAKCHHGISRPSSGGRCSSSKELKFDEQQTTSIKQSKQSTSLGNVPSKLSQSQKNFANPNGDSPTSDSVDQTHCVVGNTKASSETCRKSPQEQLNNQPTDKRSKNQKSCSVPSSNKSSSLSPESKSDEQPRKTIKQRKRYASLDNVLSRLTQRQKNIVNRNGDSPTSDSVDQPHCGVGNNKASSQTCIKSPQEQLNNQPTDKESKNQNSYNRPSSNNSSSLSPEPKPDEQPRKNIKQRKRYASLDNVLSRLTQRQKNIVNPDGYATKSDSVDQSHCVVRNTEASSETLQEQLSNKHTDKKSKNQNSCSRPSSNGSSGSIPDSKLDEQQTKPFQHRKRSVSIANVLERLCQKQQNNMPSNKDDSPIDSSQSVSMSDAVLQPPIPVPLSSSSHPTVKQEINDDQQQKTVSLPPAVDSLAFPGRRINQDNFVSTSNGSKSAVDGSQNMVRVSKIKQLHFSTADNELRLFFICRKKSALFI